MVRLRRENDTSWELIAAEDWSVEGSPTGNSQGSSSSQGKNGNGAGGERWVPMVPYIPEANGDNEEAKDEDGGSSSEVNNSSTASSARSSFELGSAAVPEEASRMGTSKGQNADAIPVGTKRRRRSASSNGGEDLYFCGLWVVWFGV